MPRSAPPTRDAGPEFHFPPLSATANSELGSSRMFAERTEAADLAAEVPQNVIDGRRPGCVPTMRVTLLTLPRVLLAPLGFEGLAAHAAAAGGPDPAELGQDVRVMLIRDDGRGLGGEWRDGFGKSPWQRFVRWVGAAGKGGSDGGRHGVGRLVMLAPSQVRGAWVFTVRDEDGEALFSGISELAPHQMGGVHHQSFGVFGAADPVLQGNVLPLRGEEAFKAARLLGDARGPGETGLTVAVPALRPGFGFAGLRLEVLRSMALSVAVGLIRVEVADLDSGDTMRLTPATVRAELARAAADTGDGALRDAVEVLRLSDLPSAVDLPSLDEAEAPAAALADLRARYAAGHPVAATIPVTVRRDGCEPTTCRLTLAAMRSPGLALSWKIRMRDGIVTQRCVRSGEGRATLVSASGSDLATMLGDAEDPTHTRWRSRHARARGWRSPEAAIEIWNEAQDRFAALLGGASGTRVDVEVLADVFAEFGDAAEPAPLMPQPVAAAEGADGAAAGPSRQSGEDVPAEAQDEPASGPDPAPGPEAETAARGGEVISLRMFADEKAGRRGFEARLTERGRRSYRSSLGRDDTRYITLETWHPVEGRTSPGDWSPSDYVLGEDGFDVHVEGAESYELEGNRLVLRGVTEALRVLVAGPFDRRRDLAVKIARRGR